MSRTSRRQRRIAVITGTRAEYGLLRSTMQAIAAHRDLELQIVATGSHLLRKFGHTVDQIVSDGWHIDARVRMQKGTDDSLDQAIGLSNGVAGIAKFLDRCDTDVVLVLGDRIEALAGGLAAVSTGRVLAHCHGGDVAQGDFDDSFRHAITKLAHVHLAATSSARRRIIRMGEHQQNVIWVGAPGLDQLREVIGSYNRRPASTDRVLILQHPIGRSAQRERRVMKAIFAALEGDHLSRTVIYPNSDRGHTGILDAIQSQQARSAGSLRVVRSLARQQFLEELIEADLLIGNSSCGIIEAGTAGTAAVNIGARQLGRLPSGPSVVSCGESVASISAAIREARQKRPRMGGVSVYGREPVGPRIASILAQLTVNEAFFHKIISY